MNLLAGRINLLPSPASMGGKWGNMDYKNVVLAFAYMYVFLYREENPCNKREPASKEERQCALFSCMMGRGKL
jgi:hypothetical protein